MNAILLLYLVWQPCPERPIHTLDTTALIEAVKASIAEDAKWNSP